MAGRKRTPISSSQTGGIFPGKSKNSPKDSRRSAYHKGQAVTVADPLENVRAWWDEDAEIDPEAYDPADVEPSSCDMDRNVRAAGPPLRIGDVARLL